MRRHVGLDTAVIAAGCAAVGCLLFAYVRRRRSVRKVAVVRAVTGCVRAVYGDARPVPVRGRAALPSGESTLLPETISPPTSAGFPLVLLATELAGTTDVLACAREVGKLLGSGGLLNLHGAVLLRGLPVRTPEDFGAFCAALGWMPSKLGGGGTARTVLAGNIRTASDEPPEHTIEPHMDMAHNPTYPSKIGFMMLHGPPAGCGGETVLVDMRLVTRDMKALGLDRHFASRGGVLYRKKLWSAERASHSFTWQRRFFAPSRQEVDAQLTRGGFNDIKWGDDESVSYTNTLPVMTTHPETQEPLWFNGVHTNHRDYFDLAPHIDTRDGSPFDTCYADGGEIGAETLAQVRASMWGRAVAVTLQTGDIVIVDNLLAAHGRLGWTPGVPRMMLLNHFE